MDSIRPGHPNQFNAVSSNNQPIRTLADGNVYQENESTARIRDVHRDNATMTIQPRVPSTFLHADNATFCHSSIGHQQISMDSSTNEVANNSSLQHFFIRSVTTMPDMNPQNAYFGITPSSSYCHQMRLDANRSYEGYRSHHKDSTITNSEGLSIAPNLCTATISSYPGSLIIPSNLPNNAVSTVQNKNRLQTSDTDMKYSSRTYSSFPFTLYLLLEEAHQKGYEHIVSWHSGGRSFRVKDQAKFVSEVMPQYFLQTRFSSFLRQLAIYGFVRIPKSQDSSCSYYHDQFMRGVPKSCSSIKRKPIKGRKGPPIHQVSSTVEDCNNLKDILSNQTTENVDDCKDALNNLKATRKMVLKDNSLSMYPESVMMNHRKPYHTLGRVADSMLNTKLDDINATGSLTTPSYTSLPAEVHMFTKEQKKVFARIDGTSLYHAFPKAKVRNVFEEGLISSSSIIAGSDVNTIEKQKEYDVLSMRREICDDEVDSDTSGSSMAHFLSDINFDMDA